jgi:hypothetical protein
MYYSINIRISLVRAIYATHIALKSNTKSKINCYTLYFDLSNIPTLAEKNINGKKNCYT